MEAFNLAMLAALFVYLALLPAAYESEGLDHPLIVWSVRIVLVASVLAPLFAFVKFMAR